MRITKRQLGRIIKEELHRVLSEHPDPWERFDRLHDQQKDEPDIYGTSTLSPELTARAARAAREDARAAEKGEGQSIWDDDYDVSPCCGVDQDSDIDICTNCGEHTGGGIPASEYYS